jgi:hypothetical protein
MPSPVQTLENGFLLARKLPLALQDDCRSTLASVECTLPCGVMYNKTAEIQNRGFFGDLCTDLKARADCAFRLNFKAPLY